MRSHVGGKTYCAGTSLTLLGASLAEGASGHGIGVARGAGGAGPPPPGRGGLEQLVNCARFALFRFPSCTYFV